MAATYKLRSNGLHKSYLNGSPAEHTAASETRTSKPSEPKQGHPEATVPVHTNRK